MRKLILGSLAVLGLVGASAFAAAPGAHRTLTPELFDMTRAAPNIFVDDPTKSALVRDLVARAETNVAALFGQTKAMPRYIFCTTAVCKTRFGLRPSAMAYGYHIILIGPSGINEVITTHERIHTELHRFMGVTDIWTQRFPAWFNEGLASHWSGDDRLNRPETLAQANWIRAAQTFRDWGRLHPARNWRDTYGAAARVVQQIETQIGRDGILALIEAVGQGADFARTLAELVPELAADY